MRNLRRPRPTWVRHEDRNRPGTPTTSKNSFFNFKGENRMNWDLVKSYFPNPERAKEYYIFVEELRMMVGRIKRSHKTYVDMKDFAEDVITTFDTFYHGLESTARKEE